MTSSHIHDDSSTHGTTHHEDVACSSSGEGRQIREVPAECLMISASELIAKGALVIAWQEVDRLLDKEEYAAALLVAAVNVEFILWVNLCRFSTASKPSIQDNRISSMWGNVTNPHPDKLTLSSLRKVADYMSQRHGLVLVGSWEPVVSDIEDVRNCIAHERGYFAKLTQLRDPNWSETRIRQVLNDAKAFCHGNAA